MGSFAAQFYGIQTLSRLSRGGKRDYINTAAAATITGGTFGLSLGPGNARSRITWLAAGALGGFAVGAPLGVAQAAGEAALEHVMGAAPPVAAVATGTASHRRGAADSVGAAASRIDESLATYRAMLKMAEGPPPSSTPSSTSDNVWWGWSKKGAAVQQQQGGSRARGRETT